MDTTTTTDIKVGDLGTSGCGGDCYPHIITAVSPSGKQITAYRIEHILVHGPNKERTHGDHYSANAGHLILGDIIGEPRVYTLRNNGKWIPKGLTKHNTHKALRIGDAVYRQNPCR
jgi:hypothetical protein